MPGLDRQIIDAIDHGNLIQRIRSDIRSDFILAPHIDSIFVHAADEVWQRTSELLAAGNYQPGLPLTISVPKERGFVRPGSILLPFDRVVYQLLVDSSSNVLEGQLDRQRAFSHVVSNDVETMFEPAHECWDRFQQRVLQMCGEGSHIVKADIANYFERIPQHHLINLMRSGGCTGAIVNLTEELLLSFQERDSFGIIQGVYPSDLLGNFFLSEFDSYCELNGIPSARYVDDIYMSFSSEAEAREGLISLIEHLRREGLHLNEYKSGIHLSNAVVRDESAIDDLFENARNEAHDILVDFAMSGYGFSADWEVIEDPENEHVRLIATNILYNSRQEYVDQADKIDRFCLPLMRAAGSDYAVDDVVAQLTTKPHLTRLYYSYLSRFVADSRELVGDLSRIIQSNSFITDYQRMYVLGALFNAEEISRDAINVALQWMQSPVVAQEARAFAAIFVSRHGNPNQKRAVRLAYEGEQSEYVRAAILFSSRYFTGVERRTCRLAWGGHSQVNALIAQSIVNAE